MTEKVKYRFNRFIDSLLIKSEWAVDEQWGLEQLAKYVDEVEMVSNGILSFEDLGYSDRRAEMVGTVLKISQTGQPEITSLSDSDIPKGSIAHLQLRGIMKMEDGLSSRGIRSLCNEIAACNENPNISGIILEVNSGGGESLAGHFLNSAIKDSKIPVVVWGHFIASAALNGTAPADYIMLSSKGAEIGSIGTMVALNKEYVNWYKENYQEIYSDKSPDKNKWWREILKGNEKPLIQEINKNVEAFHSNVLEFRKLPEETRDSTLRGGMFIAQEGVERGLADSIGTFHDAIDLLTKIIDGQSNSQTKNFTTMNFQSAYHNLVAMLNSFFGWDLKEDSSSEVVGEQLKTVGETFQAAVDSAVAKATSNFNEALKTIQDQLATANETVKSLNDKVVELEASSGSVDSSLQDQINNLTEQVTQLTESNQKLAAEKTDLENKIAELAGTAGDTDDNSVDVLNGSAKTFMDTVGNISIEGDSTY